MAFGFQALKHAAVLVHRRHCAGGMCARRPPTSARLALGGPGFLGFGIEISRFQSLWQFSYTGDFAQNAATMRARRSAATSARLAWGGIG